MRFRALLLLIVGQVAVLAAQAPSANPSPPTSHLQAAEELLHLLGADRIMKTAGPMIQAMTQQTQLSSAGRQALDEYLAKHLNWADLKSDVIPLYTARFSEAEMREMITFYKSPAGAKLIAATPAMTAQTMAMVQRRLAPHMQELMDLLAQKIP